MLAGLRKASSFAEARGDFDAVAELARRQLALTPWDEAAHRALMQALAMQGQRNDALAQFDRCYEVLQQELGVEPSDATIALYEQIATGVVMRESDDAPSLPRPATLFIGRIAEISHIIRTLSQPDCQILTLTGAGGTGKTRLALAVAEQVIERLGREVAFVSLVGVTTTAQAQAVLAKALRVRCSIPTMAERQLSETVRDRAPLLVFDNAEPLLVADGNRFVDWLNVLIADVPDTRILITSRQPLHAQMEWVLPIGGMAVPHSAEPLSPEQWRQFDAIALFEQRARQARVTFALTRDNFSSVVRLCQLLGGSPLAIELAAAQMRNRTVAGLVAELEQQPDLLDAELRDLPLRHRSLRTVFEHSWQLLDAAERETLVQCAVFANGFSRAAARAVLGENAALLENLVDHALLMRREARGQGHYTRTVYDVAAATRHGCCRRVPDGDTDISGSSRVLLFTMGNRASCFAECGVLQRRGGMAAGAEQRHVHVPLAWDPAWLTDSIAWSIRR